MRRGNSFILRQYEVGTVLGTGWTWNADMDGRSRSREERAGENGHK